MTDEQVWIDMVRIAENLGGDSLPGNRREAGEPHQQDRLATVELEVQVGGGSQGRKVQGAP